MDTKNNSFYTVKKECPILCNLLVALKEDGVFDCRLESKQEARKKTDFYWKNYQSKENDLLNGMKLLHGEEATIRR